MSNDIGGVWRTVGGRRIFIKDGQDLAQAMKESGKFINSAIKGDSYKRKESSDSKENTRDLEIIKSKLQENGVIFDDGFPKRINKEYVSKQLNALNDIIENDDKIKSIIKQHPLTIKEDIYTLNAAYYSHMPDGFEGHSLNFGVFKNKEDINEINSNINHYREKGQWISKEMSNISNDEYVIYHEMGHLKEKIMVENYYKENPSFKEKYYKKIEKAKTQEEFDTYYHNMYKDALYHIEQETLLPIQEKNGTIKASNGRNGTSSYGQYGLKEIGTYGNSLSSYELISEGNVIYSNPTIKGKNSYIYKDISELFERWYK